MGLRGQPTGYIYLLKINWREKIGPFTLQLEHKVRITSSAGGAGGVWLSPQLLGAHAITSKTWALSLAPVQCMEGAGKLYSPICWVISLLFPETLSIPFRDLKSGSDWESPLKQHLLHFQILIWEAASKKWANYHLSHAPTKGSVLTSLCRRNSYY